MSIYIPEKIKVGYQNRNDTYTKKLAYVIYYDEKGKLRKETSWNSWRDEKIEPDDFDNEPTRGFVLNKKAGDCCSEHWGNHRQAYCRIYDPRGFEFEITINNLLYILENCDCLKGKGLDGEFVYGWDGKDLVLIPVDSPDYKEIKTLTDKIQNGKRFKGNDLIIGATYLTKNEEKWVYMGRFDKWKFEENCYERAYYNGKQEWNYPLDESWTISPNNKYHAHRNINKGKYYWFYNSNSYYHIEFRQNIGNVLIECIDENPSQKYSEYFKKLEDEYGYNPINWSTEILLDLPYDKFVEKLTDSFGYARFIDKTNKAVDVYIKNKTYTYNNKQYLPLELYEIIKPKYKMYKRIDGKELHSYDNYLSYYRYC